MENSKELSDWLESRIITLESELEWVKSQKMIGDDLLIGKIKTQIGCFSECLKKIKDLNERRRKEKEGRGK